MKKKLIIERLESLEKSVFLEQVLAKFNHRDFLNDLQIQRGKGRNDYPVSLLWKSILGGIAYKTSSMEEMRRIMAKTPLIFPKVPSSSALSRFFQILCDYSDEIEGLGFQAARNLSGGFGPSIAIGEIDQIVFLWEVKSGLPFLFEPIDEKESPTAAVERLLDRMRLAAEDLWSGCKYLIAGEVYGEFAAKVWARYRLRAIIPLPPAKDKTLQQVGNAYYDRLGVVYCSMDPLCALVFAGFEESRETLKYRCMMRHYEVKCASYENCPLKSGIRIPLSLDHNVFMPVPRTCCRWNQIFESYKCSKRVKTVLTTYLRLGKDREKRLLCCRLAAMLLLAGASEQRTSETRL